ncbi:insulinase family protein [Alicyclobacillus sp. TC]|uniref:EF-P 5-aminopentanol modification-associated protein YfmH n=1 Tax=Alicyclobacillus sp. TC TaxID=2606450 RepID=UPI001934B373|nr:pitrilysin family protein [Alicyclobacillus sp. TC]QRF23967.1 insulinase family protein [Alicyclobacillus sp. TC]
MKRTEVKSLNLEIYSHQLSNGLRLVCIPRPGYQQVYALFSTAYGSCDNSFRTESESEIRKVPDGIAHFLEHKMFEEPDEDVFSRFAKYGASANAFTTYLQTSYLFSCTDSVQENLNVLLDFVQHPYFTNANVEKEKGIISEEIRMYDDHPDWRCYSELMKAMYEKNPVRIDIAGTVESIQEITKDTLYDCYHTFYHPENMLLVVVGGIDPQQTLDWVEQNQQKKSFPAFSPIVRQYPKEPETVYQQQVLHSLDVVRPKCLLGLKDFPVTDGEIMLRQDWLTGIVLDGLFGKASVFYETFSQSGLIDQTFSWEYEVTKNYAHAMIGGNTESPQELQKAIVETIERALSDGIEAETFERSRKKLLGRIYTSYDSLASLARDMTSYGLQSILPFHAIDVCSSFTCEQAEQRLKELYSKERVSCSIVKSL